MLPAFIYNPVIYILAYSHILHLRICLRMLFSLLKYPILFLCKLYSSPSHSPPPSRLSALGEGSPSPLWPL